MSLLDTCPFDWALDDAAVLHDTLCSAFQNPNDARFLLQRAGIETSGVNWCQGLFFFWKTAIEVSANQSKLCRLLALVLQQPRVSGYHGVWRRLLAGEATPPEAATGATLAAKPAHGAASSTPVLFERLAALIDLASHFTSLERDALLHAARLRAAPRESRRAIEGAEPRIPPHLLRQIARGAEGLAPRHVECGDDLRAALLCRPALLLTLKLVDGVSIQPVDGHRQHARPGTGYVMAIASVRGTGQEA